MVITRKKKRLKRKKFNKLIPRAVNYIDYKNVELLNSFINIQGRIVPRISSGLTAKQQRSLSKAIKRARQMALIPYTKERIRR